MAVIGNIAIGASVNTKGLAADLKAAEMKLGAFGSAVNGLGSSLKAVGPALAAVGAGALVFTALKASVGTAVDLEKAMTGLSKASNAEGTTLEILKGQLYGLSTELKGVPLDNVLAIATSLSKMGVANDQLVEQTRGVAMLTTALDDIPAEQVADQIGKLNAIFKLGSKGALQIGSALDKIADSGLSSADGILDVTSRVSGTANAMHIGAGETMAMAAALLDTGTSAEQAGSSINNLLMNMVDVSNHADFAKTAGLSVEDFSKLVAGKPMKAVEAFLGGLERLDAAGQLAALSSAGITAQERQAALQKMAQQTQKLAEYTAMAGDEFRTLNQIQQSYDKTAANSSSVFTQFSNNLQIAMGHIGDGLLVLIKPVVWFLNKALEGFNALAGWIRGGSGGTIPATVAQSPKAAAVAMAASGQGDAKAEGSAGSESAAATLSKDVASMEKDLRLQIATFGKSSDEVQIYKLALEGASAAQLANAKSLLAQLSGMEKQKKAMEDQVEIQNRMKEEGKSIWEATRTPLEKYTAEVERLKGLLAGGAIDAETFGRASTAAAGELMPDKKAAGTDGPTHAAALTAGSAEAYSAQLRFIAQGNGGKDESIKEVAKEAPKQTDLLRQLLAEMRRTANGKSGMPAELFNF